MAETRAELSVGGLTVRLVELANGKRCGEVWHGPRVVASIGDEAEALGVMEFLANLPTPECQACAIGGLVSGIRIGELHRATTIHLANARSRHAP